MSETREAVVADTSRGEIDMNRFIDLVEERPLLWDNTHVKYCNKISTKEAWNEIFVELLPGFENKSDAEKTKSGK